ncbi:YraN family protein [Candidatus Uhrbacteria bacterium]|nr:YraN family protein [Candidatus Uhrbacteria bacterium]
MSGRTALEIGKRGEDEAVRYLASGGYTILERNCRVRGGEIDIIARHGDELVFIEVKTRAYSAGAYPEERVDFFKARFFARAIKEYVRRSHVSERTYIRADIIACDLDMSDDRCSVRHIRNVELPLY